MKENNSFINIKDLVYIINPRPINKKLFKTNKKNLEKIRQYIKNIKKNIYLKEKELNYILLIKKYINPKSIIDPNTTNYNLYYLTHIILKKYLDTFKYITTNPIPISHKNNKNNKKIIQRVFPTNMEKSFVEISKIYRIINDMIINNNIKRKLHPNYYLNNFKNYNNYNYTNNYHNNKIFPLIKKLSNTFYQISKNLSENYLLEEKIQKMSRNQKIKLISQKNISEITIPYPNYIIKLNGPLINKTIKNTYIKLIHFSTNFAALYQNKELIEKLNSSETLKQNIKSLKENLKRIN